MKADDGGAGGLDYMTTQNEHLMKLYHGGMDRRYERTERKEERGDEKNLVGEGRMEGVLL